ncbi:deleted in lung and esophageal cancer protein 1-like isoform X3 [Dreissena polymorpha]|uniref:deleted in lung and esophageal cancer protein 1-like isoform X3 n=1 Tax=Dreissena polymorpha TaxID=45954 RepID=UPI0022641BE3|nr:deleted in lung and esophageal cancer protein 1-like isoform X3 [Dreissena polymorpha]
MPGQKSRGDEPSMYLQRPSTGKSQDVRHILVKSFRELFTRDAIGPDTVRNLKVSKGGDDPYHERYVDALQKVFDERQRRMEEAAMLERHIMQAQARAMSADERELNRVAETCDSYPELGLPPGPIKGVRSHFRSCLDTNLLQRHHLLTPSDYATEEPPPVPPPAAEKIPSYARDTLTSRQHTRDDLFLPPGSPPPSPAGSHSDICSIISEEPLMTEGQRELMQQQGKFPKNDAWKQQLNEDQRERERISLKNLNAMTNYQRNPRYIPPSALPPGKASLIKMQKAKPKEVGIQQKPETSPEPKEPSQVFLVSPPAVVFTNYKIGQVYELTLTLKNVSSCIRQCRALPASTTYFSIGLGQFPGEHGLVAPGMSCHYAVRFNPDSLRDFNDEIKIQTQSREPIIVPLLGRRPPPKLTVPSVLDIGYCLVGGCQVTQFVLKNHGGHGRFCIMPSSAWPTTNFKSVVRNGNVPIPPFDVRPSVLDVGPDQTALMEIVFQPPSVKSYSVDFCLVCDNCNVKHFTVKGTAERANVELVSIERGLHEPTPGELVDATAEHHIKFDQLNPFTYTDRTAVVKNITNVNLPFQWMIYKPQFDSPGANSASRRYDRVPDVDSVFSVHPPTGVLPPMEQMEFKITYAPPVVEKFHSVLHLLLNMVPSSYDQGPKGSSSANSGETRGDGGREEKEENISEIFMPHGDMPPFMDVTALEIEVKGESSPLSVVLHPYSMHVPGKNLVGTTLKKMVTMANHSHSTITFQWEPFTESYILEVEPPFGELDPGMAMDMELSITGSAPGKIDHTLYCHVMNLEDPLHMQVQAEFKGPEVSIDQPDLNFGLVRLGQAVKKEITINNMSQIVTAWSIRDSPTIPVDGDIDDPMAISELSFDPCEGQLKPLEVKTVTVTFTPVSARSVHRIIEVNVEDGQDCNIGCFAEVQTVQACLMQSEIQMTQVFKQVPFKAQAYLFNQTLLPSAFQWGNVTGDDAKDCSVELEPRMGPLEGRARKTIIINFTPFREGEFSDLRIPCKIEGMDSPLVLGLYCNAKGLEIKYAIDANRHFDNEIVARVDFGSDVQLNSSPTTYLYVQNLSEISTHYTISFESFFSKPPTPPEQRQDDQSRAISTRRMMLGRTPNLADPLSKTVTKAQADLSSAMLCQGNGAAFVSVPNSGRLPPFGEVMTEITAYADMWGQYNDTMILKVGDLEEVRIPVTMEVKGCPLTFQMTSGIPDLKPVVRFGTHVAGTASTNRSMRVKNSSPYDVRVDWQVFNLEAGDQKLMDLVVCYGNAFPLRDEAGKEIVPPAEASKPKKIVRIRRKPRIYGKFVPLPVIREPTDYIPDSADTSQFTSRENTAAQIEREEVTAPREPLEKRRPKVVSLFCRMHEGQAAEAPYSIRPSQMVIKAKSHATVSVCFTPHPTQAVSHDIECNGYILGFMSLDDPDVRGEEGKVNRSQAFEAQQLRLDMTAHLKPALLTIECGEEEGMRYRSAMSSLLSNGQFIAESLQTNSVMLSNLTLTPLTFRLVTKQPFWLVELDPSSNKEGKTRTHSTDMHTLKPRHNLIVKVAFQTTSSLLGEIADEYLSGKEATEAGRKMDILDNLVVEFNNGAEQLVPLHATLTVPQFELTKDCIDFGTCLVGQTRELQLMITNQTLSHSQWSVTLESSSANCTSRGDTLTVNTFRVEPMSGLLEANISHISNSKALLKVYFTAKHAETYEAVFAFHGILGESPRRLRVKAQGSYDAKHEAVLNV